MTLEKNSQDFLLSKFKNNEVVKVLDNEVKQLNFFLLILLKIKVKSLKETIEKLQNTKQDEDDNFEKEKDLLEKKIREMEIERINYENTIKSFQETQK